MDGSRQDQQFGARLAQRVVAEPAFAALNASGAPIFVVSGEPLSIVHLNDSARAVFGDDRAALTERLFRSAQPGGGRLADLVGSLRHSTALRLERLRLLLDAAPQTVTVLCRRLSADNETPCFAIAALGVRPSSAAQPEQADMLPAEPTAAPAENHAESHHLRESLAERHGARSPRFLWKTDAYGRFVDVTHVLADSVGDEMADILGRSVEEVAAAFDFNPAFLKAVGSGKSWSGVEVDWPLEDVGAYVPVTLGALPVVDAHQRFQGYQGYGVLHLDRVRVGAPIRASASTPAAPRAGIVEPLAIAPEPPVLTPEPAELAPAAVESAVPAPEPPVFMNYPDNIVRLRPPTARFAEPDKAALEEEAEDDANDEAASLTTVERSAFDEIARALKDGGLIAATDLNESEPAPEVALDELRAPVDETPSRDVAAVRDEAAPARLSVVAPPAGPSALEGVLDRLPVGVLVARGAQSLFVNRTLLDYLGYADRDAFERDGGLARMFFGRAPQTHEGAARPVAVQASDGEALDADAHLQIVDWNGAPATLLTLRRNRFQPRPGPEETALALARSLEEKLSRVRADHGVLEAVFEHADATAILIDHGRIDKANSAFAARLGVDRRTLQDRTISSVLVSESARALADRLSHMDRQEGALRLTLRGRIGALDAQLRRIDGRRIALTLREPATRGADEHEAALMAAEHASAAKSDFLARISHEIRTPLNAIIGFAEVMMEERLGAIGSERYKEYLKDIHSSGSHVLSLVNDLLDLSKIEAGKMELAFERVDANAVISECASIMQTQANKERVVMRLALAPQLPSIRADARALKQILLNLLSNAVKFNEPGGQVIVSSARTDTGSVVIRVKDTGIGMSDDEVQTALEPFKQIATTRQAAQKQRGTGLGLPLTKALIEANHASFTIQSRKNEGTLIEIAFPPPQVLAAE